MPCNHFQLDSIPYPAAIVDHSGRVIRVNKQAIVFAGMQEKDLLNMPVHDALHPAELAQIDCPLCARIVLLW